MTLVIPAETRFQRVRKVIFSRPVVAIVLIAVMLAGGRIVPVISNGAQFHQAREVKEQMLSQVETPEGKPLKGRDPAVQQQDALAVAASMPSGNGRRTDKPAAGVSDTVSHTGHSPADLPNTSDGVLASGCLAGYGKPGSECLPSHIVKNGKINGCESVRKYFPKGIIVSGNDRFKLDKNGNKTACDAADLA